MNVPLLLAGSLALTAAAVHGVGGELWVVRKLSPGTLPSTRFGGAASDGDPAEAVAVLSAAAFTGFGAVAMGLALAKHPPRALLHHPGPVVIAATAALAWWGAL